MVHSLDPEDFLLQSYDYHLPADLIAERPASQRHNSRLLVYNHVTNSVDHSTFQNLGNFLPSSSCLVMNNSKVFACRLKGKKNSGGEVEIFLLSPNGEKKQYSNKSYLVYPALIKASGKRKIHEEFLLDDFRAMIFSLATNEGETKNNKDDFFQLGFFLDTDEKKLKDYIAQKATIPIPPYVRHGIADQKDRQDYQTVYAQVEGSVAAPTAGLHFSPTLLDDLSLRGIKTAFVTLHVGLGTFRPVKVANITEHQMHYESYQVSAENMKIINHHHENLIAVGTTSLRVLETLRALGPLSALHQPQLGETNIFLYPGKEVKSIKGLITNFHLPQSSLIMLVSSLIGRKKTLELYQLAIQEKYRFFSYGDGMLILL
jgi:S-adenosylmethionine:tRNA ribosyltransferase-isomerase